MADILNRQPLDVILSFMISVDAATAIASVSRHFLWLLRQESTWADVAVDMRSLKEGMILHTAWPFRLCRYIRWCGVPYRLAKKFSVPIHTPWQFGGSLYVATNESPVQLLSGLRSNDLELRVARQRLWGWTACIKISLTLRTNITALHFGLFTLRSPHMLLTTIDGPLRSFGGSPGRSGSFFGISLGFDFGGRSNGDDSCVYISWDSNLWKFNWRPVESCARAGYITLRKRTFALALHLTRDDVTLLVEGGQFRCRLALATASTEVQRVIASRTLYPALLLESHPCFRDLSHRMATTKTSDIVFHHRDRRDVRGRT